MVSIVGKTSTKWGSYISHSSIARSLKRFVYASTKNDETAKTMEAVKGIFISPELKRDLLEELIITRSQRLLEHKIDGLSGPGDWGYDATIRHMIEEFKIRQNIKE